MVDHRHLRRHPDRVAPDRDVRRLSATADPGHPYDANYGRVATITIQGSAQTITIPGTEFYVDLGLNSDLFAVTGSNGSSLSIIGQGWGHGIGMGQWARSATPSARTTATGT